MQRYQTRKSEGKLTYPGRRVSRFVFGKRCADSPPPCGEGLGVGGTPTFDILQSPPPCPSPTRGEGTLWRAPVSSSRVGVAGERLTPFHHRPLTPRCQTQRCLHR